MKNLEDNINFLLHDQIALIENIESYLFHVKETLFEWNDVLNDVSKEYIFSKIKNVTISLRSDIDEFIEFLKQRGIEHYKILPFEIFNDSFQTYLETASEINPTFVFDKILMFEKDLKSIRREPIPRESTKPIRNNLLQIKKEISIYFISQAVLLTQAAKQKSSDFLTNLKNEESKSAEQLPFEICGLINQVIKEFQYKSDNKKIEFKKNYKNEKYYVIGSRPLVLRAFENIINNAIKYNRTLKNYDVWIEIKVLDFENYITIEIENWGIGILGYEIEQGLIFKFGYKGEYSVQNNIEGSGIGLFFARDVIEKCGGTIEIESKPVKRHLEISKDSNFLTTVKIKLKKISAHNKVHIA